MCGNIFGFYNFGEGAATSRDAAKHCTMHQTGPHKRELFEPKFQVLRLRDPGLDSAINIVLSRTNICT